MEESSLKNPRIRMLAKEYKIISKQFKSHCDNNIFCASHKCSTFAPIPDIGKKLLY